MLRRIASLARNLVVTYRSWRGLFLAAGFATLLVAGFVLPFSPSQRLSIVLLTGSFFVLLAAILGIEIARQDRLRSTAFRAARGDNDQQRSAKPEVAHRRARRWVQTPRPARVTVVVTAHNEAAHINDCLASITDQTLEDWECLVIDDLSTDRTLDQAFEFAKADSRFRAIHSDINRGLPGARNLGLAMASAPLITFLDGDDYLYPEALSRRVAALLESADSWAAASYCAWHSVPEDSPRLTTGPVLPARARITWLDAIYECPVISSAPLLITEIVSKVGGFDPRLPTAEDYDLWSRILRQGFVFEPASYTGIAYRQKRGSMFRSTALDHAEVTNRIIDRNVAAMEGSAVVKDAPFPFLEPAATYQQDLAHARRHVIALVGAIAGGDLEGAADIGHQLAKSEKPWLSRALKVDTIVEAAAIRSERFDEDAFKQRAEQLQRDVLGLLRPILRSSESHAGPSPASRVAASSRKVATSPDEHVVSLREPLPVSIAPGLLNRTVVLMPSAPYHVDEMGPLSVELDRRGFDVAFCVISRRWPDVLPELRKYRAPVHLVIDESRLSAYLSGAAAVVTLNDWGDYRAAIETANDLGIPTFGKVEGAQDFSDVDVHWERKPYRRVSTVLCQGLNDLEATDGDRHIVGSTRLERIWTSRPRKARESLAVINLNFTFGVLEHARELWLQTAVDACRGAGVPYVLSLHPAERSTVGDDYPVADEPMRHLLTQATVLISRFSTVPFEAMARGVPFIYHNPHHEKVPTFANPDGAFLSSTTAAELKAALIEAGDWLPDYRDRCAEFFLRQVDVDPEISSETRTAMVIESVALGL